MLRLLALASFLLAPTLVRAQPAHPIPCDPWSRTTRAAIPRALQLRTTCGNGRMDTYATRCDRHQSGGCGFPHRTSTRCIKNQEVCDGRALGGASCQSLGYAGGVLRCAATCDRIVVDRCTLCLATGSCRERTVGADDFQDLTLIAQGNAVRAFWSDAKRFYVADVDARGSLGRARILAAVDSFRLVPMQVGTSALTIVGARDKPQLSVVPANGAPKRVPLPGTGGSLFLPLLPVDGKDLALGILGEPFSATLVLLDATGTQHPLAALYAQNAYRRAALIALPAGKHRVRWSTYEAELVTQRGDFLWLMHDYRTIVTIVRNGSTMMLGNSVRKVSGPEARDVELDGTVVASFGTAEDVIDGVKHARTAKASPTTKLLAPRAHESAVSVVRTATREVHAARVPHDPVRDSAGSTLAIAVRTLVP